MGSASAEMVVQGEVNGVTHRLDLNGPWLAPAGPILKFAACTGLENATLNN